MTTADTSATTDSAHSEGLAHPVSVPLLIGVLIALLFLTVLTVAVTYVDMGRLNIWIALGIAFVKGTLVCLYFMHLRWDKPFNLILLVSSLFFVALFLGFCIMDTSENDYFVTAIPEPVQELRKQGKLKAAARLEIAQLDRAVKAFHNKNNIYPTRLDQLVPNFLGEIPTDPWTGKPYLYEARGATYSIISYGPDQKKGGDDDVHAPEHKDH